MTDEKREVPKISAESTKAAGEAAYMRAMFLHGSGKKDEAMIALDQALGFGYAPAILTSGSIQYQCEQQAQGKQLLLSLVSLPPDTENLFDIIEEAGAFLISINETGDALELYRKAAAKFPDEPTFHQRFGQCAAQEDMFEEAIAAGQRAIELAPENAVFVSDLGWTMFLAERYSEAEALFLRALEIDPENENARMNLEYARDMRGQLPPT
jgi:tetratricopeptide (TPR) repeat protein